MQRETRIRQMTKRPQGLDQSSALLVLGLRPLCGTLMATGGGANQIVQRRAKIRAKDSGYQPTP